MFFAILFISYVFGSFCYALESVKTVDSPIEEVKLFKNGFTLVTRSVTLTPQDKTVLIPQIPKPVHGTFWLDEGSDIELRFFNSDVQTIPETLTPRVLLEQLTGKKIDVFIEREEMITGKVLSITEKPGKSSSSSIPSYASSLPALPKIDKFLVIETNKGIELINTYRIWRLRLHGDTDKIKTLVRQPSIQITANSLKETRKVRYSYLTRGMAWIPSYRLDLKNDQEGSLTMKAVIKNELMDITDAQFHLISGFPAIKFEQATTPISPETNLNRFFSELSRRPSSDYSSPVMTQRVMSNIAMHSQPTSTLPTSLADGYDVHYTDIGRHSLKKGEAMMKQIAHEQIKFKRIVEWIIPDDRDDRGRYHHDRKKFQDELWDAVRFSNPYSFPMTTAPMAIYEGGRLYGQNLSYWSAPGEKVVVRITKSLSIRAKHTELEQEGKRERVMIMKNDHRKSVVEGKLVIRNYRNQTEHLVIERRFSGKLLSAEGEPTKELLSEGVYSVNEKNKLRWEIDLKKGEEITLKYQYEILVDI